MTKMHRLRAALALLLMCVMLLAACGGKEKASPEASPSPEVTAEATAEPTQGSDAEASPAPEGETDSKAFAKDWLERFFAKEFDNTQAQMTEAMRDNLSKYGGMSGLYDTIVGQAGAYRAVQDVEREQIGEGFVTYIIPVDMEGFAIDALLSIDDQNLVAALSFGQRAQGAASNALPSVVPDDFEEIKTQINPDGRFPLGATILAPVDKSRKVPGVVLVAGSGGHVRDMEIGGNRVFEQIACGLAAQGVAVLRYDKRLAIYLEEMIKDPHTSVEEEYVQDTIAAVDLLAATEGVDPERIFILGHSQGAMVTPRILLEGAKAQGMILLAGSNRTLFEIMQDQETHMLEEMKARNIAQTEIDAYTKQISDWQAQIARAKEMTKEEAWDDGSTAYNMPIWYVYDMIQYQPMLDSIKQLALPTLALQGSKDVQVFPDKDFGPLLEGLGGQAYASTRLYEGLNHLFMPSQAEGMMDGLDEYNQPSKIPENVFVDIATWIQTGALPQ